MVITLQCATLSLSLSLYIYIYLYIYIFIYGSCYHPSPGCSLLQNSLLPWSDDPLAGVSWSHAHVPSTHESLGTLKQQCQHPGPSGIPSRCSTWGERWRVWPSAPVLDIISEQVQKGGRDIHSLHEAILLTTDSETPREGRDKMPLEGKWPVHWKLQTTAERIKQGTNNWNDISYS